MAVWTASASSASLNTWCLVPSQSGSPLGGLTSSFSAPETRWPKPISTTYLHSSYSARAGVIQRPSVRDSVALRRGTSSCRRRRLVPTRRPARTGAGRLSGADRLVEKRDALHPPTRYSWDGVPVNSDEGDFYQACVQEEPVEYKYFAVNDGRETQPRAIRSGRT